MTETHRHLSRLWMSGSEPQTMSPHSMGEFMSNTSVMFCRSPFSFVKRFDTNNMISSANQSCFLLIPDQFSVLRK